MPADDSNLARADQLIRSLIARHSGWPRHVDIELTHRCNLRCARCWLYGPNGRGDRYRGTEMSTRQVADLIDRLPLGTSLYFGGGEPLTRGDFSSIATHVKSRGLGMGFTTNGILLTERDCDELVSAGVDRVNLSIDGPEEVHDRLKGPGTFAAAVTNLGNLLERRQAAGTRAPVVTVNLTLTPLLVGRLEETIGVLREASGDRIDRYRVHHLWYICGEALQRHQTEVRRKLGGCAPGAGAHQLPEGSIPDLTALAGETARLAAQPDVESVPRLAGQELVNYYSESPSTRRCTSPWRALVIKPNGDVYFCPDEWIDDYPLGNVRQMALENIWRGRQAGRFRKVLGQVGSFPACKRCSWLR